jgi:hypothetical protein
MNNRREWKKKKQLQASASPETGNTQLKENCLKISYNCEQNVLLLVSLISLVCKIPLERVMTDRDANCGPDLHVPHLYP